MDDVQMTRVAWFTPLPPVRSGIAKYSVELLPLLARTCQIEIFVESPPDDLETNVGSVCSAHDFVWKQARNPYDVIVYQLGNSPYHDYMWPYLVRYPGLVVLHDGQFHHSRARALLLEGRTDDYRTEFSYNHPNTHHGVAELGVTGLLGSLTYLWSMRRIVVDASRSVLVHNSWLANELRLECPETPVEVVEMGVPDLSAKPGAREIVRQRHQVPDGAVLFSAFGKLTPEKRIPQILRALVPLEDKTVPWHLMLCGETVDHYDALENAQRLGISHRVSVTGYLNNDEMAAHLSAADVCFCLRWPSSRETSASWLRFLAAGKTTVINDLVHTSDVPSLDPRDWMMVGGQHARNDRGQSINPFCVSIDIVDEDHSLAVAVARLVVDSKLRASLGAAARLAWKERFTLERMAAGYSQIIESTRSTKIDDTRRNRLPSHLLHDGMDTLRSLLEDFDRSHQLFK